MPADRARLDQAHRSHLVSGEIALILPCLGRSEIDRQACGEQFVTVEDSMGIVNPSRGHLEPASAELRSEPAIIARLAEATLGTRSCVNWGGLVANYDRIRDHINHVVPGFGNFNARIREGSFYLPNDAREKRKFSNKEAGLQQGQIIRITPSSHPAEAVAEFHRNAQDVAASL
jgi:hypothetical protein